MNRSARGVSAASEPQELTLSRAGLIQAALAMGARRVCGWSKQEEALATEVDANDGGLDRAVVERLCERVRAGEDPLGNAYISRQVRSDRRRTGATYTPNEIVGALLELLGRQCSPQRIVDPGVGSGRFLIQAAQTFPTATLLGVEVDPMAALIGRANLAAVGVAHRSRILNADYRCVDLRSDTQSAFVGNPPYVRHHLIEAHWKEWFVRKSQELGVPASRLAGLHAHFFVATALNARPGDQGAFITAAEWLDVNYGSTLRELFRGRLGGQSLIVMSPAAAPFPDAVTTAAVATFRVGSRADPIRFRRVNSAAELAGVSGGRVVSRRRLELRARWSNLTGTVRRRPCGFVELGEVCRVHRGQATGANAVWIAGAVSAELPGAVLFPTVTRARELMAAGSVLRSLGPLRRVIDLPVDLDRLEQGAREAVERFLAQLRRQGIHRGYLARHRRAWWAVGLPAPAAILATYMARRPPGFSRNPLGARHINIAHGLYPREELSEEQLAALVEYLRAAVSLSDGRTYAGGLTKFEPREMERLLVPEPALLMDWAAA